MSRQVSDVVATFEGRSWQEPFADNKTSAVDALEDGKVLFFPNLNFVLREEEKRFLSPASVDPKAKNVSFNPKMGEVKHALGDAATQAAVADMMRRYWEHASSLLAKVLPSYVSAIEVGRTSFRPVEVSGRKSSPRKDDTRLHVDAFPSMPIAEKRILRVFSNVNPDGKNRHWRLGDSFERTAQHFVGRLPAPLPGAAWMLKAIGVTKGYRTRYDHMMLALHDAMKMDSEFQRTTLQNEFHFPPGSTWVVYTDMVAHASMSGQYLFEQTFYLPVSAMADPSKAPLSVLERLTGRALV